MCNDWLGDDRVEGADGAEGQTAERKFTWPEEGSACQETNKHPPLQGCGRPVEADLMGLPAVFPPSPPPFIYELYHSYSFLPPFCTFFPPHQRLSSQASGPSSHRARRRALTRCSALLRRLLNISIKFCLSGRPDDLPWRVGEEASAAWRAVEWIPYTVMYK